MEGHDCEGGVVLEDGTGARKPVTFWEGVES